MAPGAAKTSAQRRKIFPHLDETNKNQTSSSSEAGSSEANKSDDGRGASSSSNDNAKSKKGAKHPSATSKKSAKGASASANGSSSSGGGGNDAAPGEAAGGSSSVHHLLPMPLVLTVLACSGLFWVASFRDVMATGKPILDTLGVLWGQDDADANYLRYTKSTQWFDDSKGWKSKQGGLSTILAVTTDANDMGGLFVRKMSGVAGMAFHATKIWPLVFHSPPRFDAATRKWVGASWSAGHFDPVLALGMIGDVFVSAFWLNRLDEMKNAGAGGIAIAFVLASLVEAFIFGLYLLSRRMNYKAMETRPAATGGARTNVTTTLTRGYDPAEDPNSIPSRIVARTIAIVSSLIALLSLRDLFFPGKIISYIPRDDIYLEWTGAFLHSPPPDTVEADEHGIEAPLFAGEKLMSQQLGMYLSLSCLFKFASTLGWSKGRRAMGGEVWENADRAGMVSSKMIWRTQAAGDAMLLGLMRLFAPAAKSASLDLRWHLMCVGYEAFVLFLYGFW